LTEGSALLRTWIALAALCSALAVVCAGGDRGIALGVAFGILLGHLFSRRFPVKSPRLPSLLLAAIFVLAAVFLRHDLQLILRGDVLPLAHLLLIGQACGSFELRRRAGLYRSLMLSGLTLALVSVAAVSFSYLLCVIAFVLVALAAMATASLESQPSDSILVQGKWTFAAFWAGSILLLFSLSGLLFWAFPRLAVFSLASPGHLPSHLEAASNLPPLLPSTPSEASSVRPTDHEPAGPMAESSEKPKPGQPTAAQPAEEGAANSSGIRQAGRAATNRVALDLTDLVPNCGDAIIMNVRSAVASYWRGLTLDRYDGRAWFPSSPDPLPQIDPAERSRALGRACYWQTYWVRSGTTRAIFIGYIPLKVLLPETKAAPAKPSSNLSYRCLSLIPDFEPDRLRHDVTWHRDPRYLELPPISARVQALAREIVRGGTTDFDKALRLEQFLRQNYRYGQASHPLQPGEESTDAFLFRERQGTCSQFASAMAVMARSVGLPARVAVGYRPGTRDLWSGTYAVRAGDAHAWVEIHFRQHGWVPFDPTPASQGRPRVLPLPWQGLAGWQGGSFVLSITSPGSLALGKLVSWNWSKAQWLLALPLVLLLGLLGRRFRRQCQPPRHFEYSRLSGSHRQMVLGVFEKLESILSKGGFRRRRPTETPAEYLKEAGKRYSVRREPLEWLCGTISQAAYDQRPFPGSLAREATRRMQDFIKDLAKSRKHRLPIHQRHQR